MTVPFPSPTNPAPDRREVLLGYLAFFRSVVTGKLAGLPDDVLRTSVLPSGWSPLELVHHLAHVEHRWLEWGFLGDQVDDPWADHVDGRWQVAAEDTADDVVRRLAEQAERSDTIVRAHELDEVGAPGARWDGAAPATLERVLLHLVQEYARHAGHLDVVRELIDGSTGEEQPAAGPDQR